MAIALRGSHTVRHSCTSFNVETRAAASSSQGTVWWWHVAPWAADGGDMTVY